MRRALDDLAAAASMRIVAWTCTSVDESRREWVDAMAAELAAIESGWQKLVWAIDGLPLVWSFGKWRTRRRESLNRRSPMNTQLPSMRRSTLDSFVLNAAALLVWWLMLGGWLRTLFPNGMREWQSGTVAFIVGSATGALIAVSVRRLGAAYVLAGFAAMQLVEFAFHLQYGNRVVQGGPAHFATMAAALLAVPAAAYAVRTGKGVTAQLAFALGSFAAAELGIRAMFGFLWGMTGGPWTFRHFFRDSQTNFAILGCAILGAVVGTLIGKWGGIFTIQWPTRLTADRSSQPASAERSATP